MKRLWKSILVVGAAFAVSGILAGGASAGGPASYQVTINNLTSGQPLSPPIVVAHTSEATVWAMGQPASVGVATIAETGVERISVGALTHSAPALDIALDLQQQKTGG